MNRRLKIGIIEDEPWTAAFLRGVLEDLGHTVLFTAASGAEAREAMAHTPARLLFMDINILGPEDGIALAASFQKTQNPPKIVYITAYTDAQTLKEAAGTAPAFFLSKPFDAKDIEIALSMAAASPATPTAAEAKASESRYTLCPETGAPMRGGEYLDVSPMERRIVARLLQAAGGLVSYDELAACVWDDPDAMSHGSLRNAVMRLRRKLPDLRIETVKELGYTLR
jgi:DNA-binding response OmpR family regulator